MIPGIIYKITNTINGKVYIGQTKQTVKQRFKQHIKCANHPSQNKGSTYLCNAMRHYGVDNFTVEIIEECQDSELNERERFWVRHYNSFQEQYGYNLTLGGDCGIWVDDVEVQTLWDAGLSVSEIEKQTGHSRTTLSRILQQYKNYSRTESKHRQSIISSIYQYTPVIQYAQDGTFLNRFDTPQEAVDYLGTGLYKELIKKCRQPNRMYYGYQWRFESDDPPGPFVKRKDLCKPVEQFDIDDQYIARYDSITQAAEKTGVYYQGISYCCNGRKKEAGGFHWKYAA